MRSRPSWTARSPGPCRVQTVTALLLEARARDALGDQATAGRVLERALDVTESNGILLPFLLDPVPVLLERHRRSGTAHPALISKILDLLRRPAGAARGGGQPPRSGGVWGGSSPRMNSSPTARPASCATCRPTSRCTISPMSYSSR
jgi:hypothetical protein